MPAKDKYKDSILTCITREEVLVAGNGGEMCSCFRTRLELHGDSKRRHAVQQESSISLSVSTQLREITVRIVHAGGRIEMYQKAIPVSRLIQKYPGMCIARPSVFKRPHESLLSDDDVLLPGNKYLVIRCTTVEKLKRRHMMKGGLDEPAKRDEPVLELREVEDVGYDPSEESVCSSRDFYVTKNSWSILGKQVKGKRQFVPPIQKPRLWKETDWEPSLTSIQEVSP